MAGLVTAAAPSTARPSTDRKNYVYPDLPKAYQICQFDMPLCENGEISFYVGEDKKTVRIRRIHIEEDAGKLLHDNRFSGTLVDFNRCGIPLIEIVSQPDMHSPEEARAYLEALKAVLECLGICNCRMQEGNIRCRQRLHPSGGQRPARQPRGSEKTSTPSRVRCAVSSMRLSARLKWWRPGAT